MYAHDSSECIQIGLNMSESLRHSDPITTRTLCVAACCSVLQRVAACCSVTTRTLCVAACCSALQRVAASLLARSRSQTSSPADAVCCSVLQCVAACCSVLQHVAVRYDSSICQNPCNTPPPVQSHACAARHLALQKPGIWPLKCGVVDCSVF